MKVFSSIAAATAAAAIGTGLLASKSAEAKPFIYVDNYEYNGTTEMCLKNAKKALEDHNFDPSDVDKTLLKKGVVSVTGYHREEYLSAEIQCDQKMGVTVLGVSGLNDDITYEFYGKLHEAEW